MFQIFERFELCSYYLSKHSGSDLRAKLFGHIYDAPFGIASIGLQGLM
ncbi:MAG: alpha-hydroxy-acid oxidizing protein [Flavobacteriales bacterium AspAUS03]